jgi:hypothetical protein
LEEFKLESRLAQGSEYSINESWAKQPALRRKVRRRLEELVPNKEMIFERIVAENQLFYKPNRRNLKYIPQGLIQDSIGRP